MLEKKRVHVVPLGYEHDRIVIPLVEYKADKVVIVKRREERLGVEFLERLKKTLDAKRIPYEIEEAEILDLVDCIRVFGRIIHNLKEKGHDVYVNVSTSTSIAAIAAALAAMQWDAEPYYALPEKWLHENEREPGEPIAKGLRDVLSLQKLHLEVPDTKLLYILRFIDSNSTKGKILYRKVVERLENERWLEVDERAKHRHQALIRQFQDRYLKPLVEKWGFVELEGRTRARKIGLTEKGRQYLRMFEYLVKENLSEKQGK